MDIAILLWLSSIYSITRLEGKRKKTGDGLVIPI
jgi:hypothetical protein